MKKAILVSLFIVGLVLIAWASLSIALGALLISAAITLES